jgi:L-asparaginase II
VQAVAERSGVEEERHEVGVAVVAQTGEPLFEDGDVDTTFLIRSAAKPFQAQVALEAGASLDPLHLAIACASHSGDPVHLSLVGDVLSGAGLGPEALRCPPARPGRSADRRLAAAGDVAPSSLHHNCSGKHAAMLAACVASGWDTATYLDPGHPLQRRIGDLMGDVLGTEVGPPGVDGCGAPVWRTTVRSLATGFARLATDPRFSAVRTAMSRYPMIVSGEGRPDGLIARWLGAPAKGGAAGCMGAAVARHGVAAKAWSGSGEVAGMGVVSGLRRLGIVTEAIAAGLERVESPALSGGGRTVGRIRLRPVLDPL